MNAKLKTWMATATTVEQESLAKLAKTSRSHLYQLCSEVRIASAGLARRLELAAVRLRLKNAKLPELKREDLSPDCGACEYAKRCK